MNRDVAVGLWGGVALLLLAALLVVTAPGQPTRDDSPGPSPPSDVATPAAPSTVPGPAPDLAGARQAAALRPCPSPQPPPARGPLAGVRVPCLGAPGVVDLGAVLAGQTVLLNAWASWCAPCRDEIPVLQAYSQQPGAVPVIGIDVVSDTPTAALALLTQLGARYPSVVDDHDQVQPALRSPPIIPQSYVLTPDGNVHRVGLGGPFTDPRQIREAVARYTTR